MAKNPRSLGDWSYILHEPKDASKSSRRRRGPQAVSENGTMNNISLRRKTDGLELKPGDHILYWDTETTQDQDDTPQTGLVLAIDFGTDRFIDLQVLCFDDVEALQTENFTDLSEEELFLTPLNESILVSQVVEKCDVLTKTAFDGLEPRQKQGKKYCQRAVNEDGDILTDPFDYNELVLKCLETKGPKSLIDMLRMKTSGKTPHTEPLRDDLPSLVEANVVELESPDEAEDVEEDEAAEEEEEEVQEQEVEDEVADEDDQSDEEAEVPDDESERSDDELSESPKPKRARKNPKPSDISPAGDSAEKPLDETIVSETSSPKAKPRGRPRGRPPKASPTKSETPQTPQTPQTPTKPKKQKVHKLVALKDEYAESMEFIKKVIGTKRLRIKDRLELPSFNQVSPRKRKPQEQEFDLLDTSSSAFKDLKHKLQASTKLSSLPCRDDEFTSLYLNIESAIREKTGCCLYVSGTPGIGKTATIREVMQNMKELKELEELGDFEYHEINGLKLINPNDAYTELWASISGLEVSSANAANLLDAYFKEPSASKKPMVVMIDELDQVATKKQSVMYNFFNWPTYPESQLVVLAVANTMDLPERVLSNKISSRLGLKRIQFIGYTFEQLGQIIEHRLDQLTRQAKHRVTVDKDAINFASRKVASVSGDARRALQICRRAVEIAELDYKLQDKDSAPVDESFHVKIPHIAKAINETINSPIAKYIATLSFGSKLLLTALLLRMKRSGLSENSLGDIIDEMKILLTMASSKHLIFDQDLKPPLDMADVLLNSNLCSPDNNIRIEGFRFLLSELVENGILTMQNIKIERYRHVSLNVSQEEVLTTLKRDPLVSSLL